MQPLKKRQKGEKMETKLTERDKKLLYILGFIVIVFIFGWLIIRPMLVVIDKTEESIAAAESLKRQNEFKVTGVSTAVNLVERFKTDLDDSMTEYYEPMDSSEIDKMFTSYVLKKGLYAKDLMISMPGQPVNEQPYVYSEAGAKALRLESIANASSLEDTMAGSVSSDSALGMLYDYTKSPLESYTDAQMDVTDTSVAGVYCAEITIVMTGDPDTEQALLDEVMYMPSIRLTGFAWDDVEPVAITDEEGVTEIIESDDKQLTVMLNLYMYDKDSAGFDLSDD